MISSTVCRTLRDNHDEVVRRWLENVHGQVAEDFEQTLDSPMGKSAVTKLLGCMEDFFSCEGFDENEVLRCVRDISYNISFRRAAVGFGLADIVAGCQAFHAAVRETILNHANPTDTEEAGELLGGIIALNRIEDTAVMGRIAGYFAYHNYHERDAGAEVA